MLRIVETVSKAEFAVPHRHLDFVKCLGEIGDYVVDMLCTDWKTDSISAYTLVCKLLICQLWVSCCSGVNYKALYICNVCEQREYL